MSEELTLPVCTEVERGRALSHTSRVLRTRAQRRRDQSRVLQDQARHHLTCLAALAHDFGAFFAFPSP